jgi:NAD(P)H-hydrate epimerase
VIPILDARRMRAAERAAIRGGVASARLMENAAEALVEELLRAGRPPGAVVVVCGPGNNGGDGLASARLLARRGIRVSVFTLGDPDAYRGDAAANAARARAAGLELVSLSRRGAVSAFSKALVETGTVVDALFGTGLARPLKGGAASAVEAITRPGGRSWRSIFPPGSPRTRGVFSEWPSAPA